MEIPGGSSGRRMLWINLIDKVGSGLSIGVTTLYFVVIAGLRPDQVGVLLGLAGAIGISGPPVAGRLVDRFRLTHVLLVVQVLRALASVLLLMAHGFWPLLGISAVAGVGDRASAVLIRLYASRVGGSDRARYRALQRTVVNLGYTIGGLGASAALSVGTKDIYRALLLADAVSFCLIIPLIARCPEPTGPVPADIAAGGESAQHSMAGPGEPKGRTRRYAARRNPWRDLGYVGFVATDAFLYLDSSILRVGIPLWIVQSTSAPRVLAALLFVINATAVVLFQVPLARYGSTPHRAARSIRLVAGSFLLGGGAMAVSAVSSTWIAASAILAAALAYTFAEIFHAITTWELSVALAPDGAQGSYLGMHGVAQATERALGPLLVTSVVIAAGPVGWIGLGTGLVAASALQQRLVLRCLKTRRPSGVVPPASVVDPLGRTRTS